MASSYARAYATSAEQEDYLNRLERTWAQGIDRRTVLGGTFDEASVQFCQKLSDEEALREMTAKSATREQVIKVVINGNRTALLRSVVDRGLLDPTFPDLCGLFLRSTFGKTLRMFVTWYDIILERRAMDAVRSALATLVHSTWYAEHAEDAQAYDEAAAVAEVEAALKSFANFPSFVDSTTITDEDIQATIDFLVRQNMHDDAMVRRMFNWWAMVLGYIGTTHRWEFLDAIDEEIIERIVHTISPAMKAYSKNSDDRITLFRAVTAMRGMAMHRATWTMLRRMVAETPGMLTLVVEAIHTCSSLESKQSEHTSSIAWMRELLAELVFASPDALRAARDATLALDCFETREILGALKYKALPVRGSLPADDAAFLDQRASVEESLPPLSAITQEQLHSIVRGGGKLLPTLNEIIPEAFTGLDLLNAAGMSTSAFSDKAVLHARCIAQAEVIGADAFGAELESLMDDKNSFELIELCVDCGISCISSTRVMSLVRAHWSEPTAHKAWSLCPAAREPIALSGQIEATSLVQAIVECPEQAQHVHDAEHTARISELMRKAESKDITIEERIQLRQLSSTVGSKVRTPWEVLLRPFRNGRIQPLPEDWRTAEPAQRAARHLDVMVRRDLEMGLISPVDWFVLIHNNLLAETTIPSEESAARWATLRKKAAPSMELMRWDVHMLLAVRGTPLAPFIEILNTHHPPRGRAYLQNTIVLTPREEGAIPDAVAVWNEAAARTEVTKKAIDFAERASRVQVNHVKRMDEYRAKEAAWREECSRLFAEVREHNDQVARSYRKRRDEIARIESPEDREAALAELQLTAARERRVYKQPPRPAPPVLEKTILDEERAKWVADQRAAFESA